MSMVNLLHTFFLLTGVFISACSQVLLKKEANKQHNSFVEEYANPRVIFAYMMFVGATFLSIEAYKTIVRSGNP